MGEQIGRNWHVAALADDWCVLRTSGPRTLPLCRSLVAAGLAAWTPSKVTDRRRGRSRVRVEADAPIIPTFVFAPAADLGKLLALEESPISPHPDFSVFRFHGRIVLLDDRELGCLRSEEGRAALARRKTLRHAFTKGQEVEVPEGAFAGLTGKVEKDSSGKFALVCFGEFRVRVASFLLQPNGVGDPQPKTGAAA